MKPAILVLTSTYPRWPDDVEPGFVHELSRRLVRDYEVHVVAPHFTGAESEEVMDGVKVHRFGYFYLGKKALVYDGGMLTNIQRHPILLISLPFFFLSQFWMALSLARRHRVALVHAHWVIPQGIVAWWLRLFHRRAPLVITSHGGDVYGLNGWLAGLIKRGIYRGCAAVTVVSRAMAEVLREQVPDADVRVASMGVDLENVFVPQAPLEGRTDLVFIGRLVEKKGVDVLLRAFAQLFARYSDLRLRIVGHGPYRPALEQLAADLKLGDAVEFAGAVTNTEVPLWLSRHAIAVVPSVIAVGGDQEGLGLVIVEAMGCGCAVVASDLPAIRDVITPGENAILCEAGNPEALAAAIDGLLSNEAERLRLARAGRESVLAVFDWAVAAGRYRELFAELLRR